MAQSSPASLIEDRLTRVRATCLQAPAGPKKVAALHHLRRAEEDLVQHRLIECFRALDATTRALY